MVCYERISSLGGRGSGEKIIEGSLKEVLVELGM